MKFIHTSDWHIGRQFHNTSLLNDQRHVLKQLVAHIEQHGVDALLIAGDIYDRSVPPAAAVALLDEVLNEICQRLNTPIILIPGNHDSANRLAFAARQLRSSGLHILADLHNITEPVSICDNRGQQIDFYGIPYNDPEHVRDCFGNDDNDGLKAEIKSYDDAQSFLLDKIKAVRNTQHVNVLLSHCFIDGAQDSESERPLSIGGADRVSSTPLLDFDYVALGHLHAPQFKNQVHIRYSGSLLKYSFSEQHQDKSFTLVEFENSANTLLMPPATITALALEPLHDVRIIEGELADILAAGINDPNPDDYVLVRLLDRHAIIDAMGKLRSVYPNILHLEKPGMLQTGEQKTLNREQLKRGELDMFRDFFQQVSGHSISEEQDQALSEIIQQLHQQSQVS